MAGQGPNTTNFGLRKHGIIFETVILEQGTERPCPPAKPQRINRQNGDVRINFVAGITRFGMGACHGLAHNHPQGVGSGDIVPTGKHKFIAVRVFRTSVIIAHPA